MNPIANQRPFFREINLADPRTFMRRILTPQQAEQRLRILDIMQEKLPPEKFEKSKSCAELAQLAEVFANEELQFTIKIVRKEPDQFYLIEFLPSPELALQRRIETLVQKSNSLINFFTKSSPQEIIRSFFAPEEELKWLQTACFFVQDASFLKDLIHPLKRVNSLQLQNVPLISSLPEGSMIHLFLIELLLHGSTFYANLINLNSQIDLILLNYLKRIETLLSQLSNLDPASDSSNRIEELQLAIEQEKKARQTVHKELNRILSETFYPHWLRELEAILTHLKSRVKTPSNSLSATIATITFLKTDTEIVMSKFRMQIEWIQKKIDTQILPSSQWRQLIGNLETVLEKLVQVHGVRGQIYQQIGAIHTAITNELRLFIDFQDHQYRQTHIEGRVDTPKLKKQILEIIEKIVGLNLTPSYEKLWQLSLPASSTKRTHSSEAPLNLFLSTQPQSSLHEQAHSLRLLELQQIVKELACLPESQPLLERMQRHLEKAELAPEQLPQAITTLALLHKQIPPPSNLFAGPESTLRKNLLKLVAKQIASQIEKQPSSLAPAPHYQDLLLAFALCKTLEVKEITPSLKETLRKKEGFFGKAFKELLHYLKGIRLRENLATDRDLQRFASLFPDLTMLNLSGCDKITDGAIVALAKGCPKLQSLILYDCRQITDGAIVALVQHCPQLESLDLHGCNITNGAIIALAKDCPKLQSLKGMERSLHWLRSR